MEEGDTREPVAKEVRLLVPVQKSQSPQRVTYGVVLEPETEDLQGDVMTAEDIEAAAYDWMERSQAGGHMHADVVEGAKVVESYIAPCDIPVETAAGPETIRKGSWVLAMRWPEEIWESIEKGELTGYSVGGTGVRLDVEKHGNHDQSTHGNWAHGRSVTESQKEYDHYAKGGASKVTDLDDGPARAMVGMHGRPFTFSPGAQAFLADGDMRVAENITPVWMVAHSKAPIPNYEVTAHDVYFVEVRSKDGQTAMVKSSYLGVPENYRDSAPEYQEALRRAGVIKPVKKHGNHDQREHGNWARGRMTPAEEGNAAGRREAAENASRDEAESSGRPKKNDWIRTQEGRIGFISDDYGDQYGIVLATDPPSEGEPSQLSLIQGVPADKVERLTDPDAIKAARTRLKAQFPGADIPGVVTKHGNHDQSEHGNWARGRRTDRSRWQATKPKASAEDEYAGETLRSFDLIDDIEELLQDRRAPSDDFQPDWGDAGSAREIERQLAAVLGYLSGDEDAYARDQTGHPEFKTAEDAYATRMLNSFDLVEAIREALQDRPAPTDDFHPDWGHVGSANEVSRRLSEVQSFLGGRHVNTSPGGRTHFFSAKPKRGFKEPMRPTGNTYFWSEKRADPAPGLESLADAVREGLREAVAKHGSHDQSSHGNWAKDGYPSGTVDDERLYPTGGKWQGETDEDEVDLLDLFQRAKGKTVTYEGKKWKVKEIKPFKHTYGLDSVILEPKDKNADWYQSTRRYLRDDWFAEITDPERLTEMASQLPGGEKLRQDRVKKHGSHDQSSHGNWARGGKSGLDDSEEFVTGDRVKLVSNEKIDWGGLEGATGRIAEVAPGSLGWPTVYSVKLDREWVGWEDDDTIRDLEADRLTMVRRVRKHGSGDQSPHGNWAHGGSASKGRLAAWDRHLTAPTPEERRQAGEDYVRIANDEDAAAMKDLLTRGHARVDSVTRNDDGSFTVTRAFSKRQKGATEASFVRAIEYAAGQQNLTVRLLGTDEFFDSKTSESGHFMVRFVVEDKDAEYERRKGVRKHGSGDQSPHGNWARRMAETGKPYTTRDGVDIRDQPKVKRTSGGDYLETENGVTLDTRYFFNSHGARPPAHSRGHWAVFPGHDMKATENIENAIWSEPGETLADLMARLEPGEYVLGS